MKLPVSFPSEAQQLRQQLEGHAGASPGARLLAAADLLTAVEALSRAGGRLAEKRRYHDHCRLEWRERMKRFIAQHVGPRQSAE